MNYRRTLFDTDEAPATKATPIARASDPVTSHKAAAKVEKVVTVRQLQCLVVLKEHGKPMTSNELAAACCEKFCGDLKVDPQQYAKKLDNYRKRADEIKRNPKLCIILEEERNGGQLFRVKGQP